MNRQPPHWGKLERRIPATDSQQESDEFAEICAAAFTTPAGRRLAEALTERYIKSVLNTAVTESALVVHNAQRHLVRELEQQTARGLKLQAAKKGKT